MSELQLQIQTRHKDFRKLIASRAYIARPNAEVPTKEEKHEPEPETVRNEPQSEIRLVHERAEDAGPLERSPTAPVELTVVERPRPWLCEINDEVRKFYRIKEMDFFSHRRTGNLPFVRQVAMYLAKELTLASFPMIAKAIGGRDHTTAIHGYRKIERLLLADERLADEIQIITIKINERMAERVPA